MSTSKNQYQGVVVPMAFNWDEEQDNRQTVSVGQVKPGTEGADKSATRKCPLTNKPRVSD